MPKEKHKKITKFLTAVFFITGFFVIDSSAQAATGDIIYQCDFSVSSVCGASTDGGFTGTYPATGGRDNGRYLNFAVPAGSDDRLYDPFWIYGFEYPDVTI